MQLQRIPVFGRVPFSEPVPIINGAIRAQKQQGDNPMQPLGDLAVGFEGIPQAHV
jgi:hypothetical protein